MSLTLTAGNSPWSNGKNERLHHSIDRTIFKPIEEDKTISLEDALSHAVSSHTLYFF